jgi:hypothetical protein
MDWIALGSELAATEYRGRPVQADKFYVIDDKGRIEAGPFNTDHEADSEILFMSDTSGT